MSFEQYCRECEVSFRTSTCPSCGWSDDFLRSDREIGRRGEGAEWVRPLVDSLDDDERAAMIAALRSDSPVSESEIDRAIRVLSRAGQEPCPDFAFKRTFHLTRDADGCIQTTFGSGGEHSAEVICIPVLTKQQQERLDVSPASTGGERDELSPEQVTEAQDMADEVINAVIHEWREMKQGREHDMDLAYATGWNAARAEEPDEDGAGCPECGATRRPHGMDCSLWRDDLVKPKVTGLWDGVGCQCVYPDKCCCSTQAKDIRAALDSEAIERFCEGAVPVKVKGGHQERDGLWHAELVADDPILPDSYILLPRQVEGDDPKENGG